MPELVVDPVVSSADLQRALSPGQADEYGDVDGDRLTVSDPDEAERLVDTYPNVRWADGSIETDTYPDETVGRVELGEDGAAYSCGVNGCSREVDSPTDVCWQHADEDEDEDEDEPEPTADESEA